MRTIDTNRCMGCGLCATDCVNNYIELIADSSGSNKASFSKSGRCLECGHCNAICPKEAISGGKMEVVETQNDQLLSLMAAKRTVRKYIKGSSIERLDLDRIITAAQSAPTNRNRRSARIVLVKERLPEVYNKCLDYLVDEVQRTGRINPLYVPTMRMNENRNEILWNAEYLVLFIGLKQSIIDAAIAAERMQLEAWTLGIGTAYRGDIQSSINNIEELRNILDIKSNEETLVAFAMGRTDLRYLRPAVKNNRKVVYK